ncbi:MAG: hypothetical protein JO261_06575 [Alphaproteobacteria bacterium]|nr:hypothetical protein [Alphaproteobacteria bacterium]MBV9693349.1 hypothetical protein [Alphaproteobacteria bacterium]
MQPISFKLPALAAAAMLAASPASAGAFYTGMVPSVSVPSIGAGAPGNFGSAGGGGCHGGGGGSTIVINKNINIFKPVNINKNVNINKVVVINKINVEAAAFAQALAAANASAGAQVVIYGGGSYEYVNVKNESGAAASATASGHCEMQDATVVKAIHAVCVAGDGREFPASHMTAETWIDTSYEGEVARCIEGSRLKVVIGDVVQSDQGMAGIFTRGIILRCGEHEAVRHFKDGMLKCVPALSVPDCTERTNLRKFGTGDMFFSYRARICAGGEASRELDIDNGALNGGVGEDGGY